MGEGLSRIKEERPPSPINLQSVATELSASQQNRNLASSISLSKEPSSGFVTRHSSRKRKALETVEQQLDEEMNLHHTGQVKSPRKRRSLRVTQASIEDPGDYVVEPSEDELIPAADVPASILFKEPVRGRGGRRLRPLTPKAEEEKTPSAGQVIPEIHPDVPSPPSAGRRILDGFKSLLGDIRRVCLRPEEERAVIGLLFESVSEVHEAGRRNGLER